jgi:hypothetical protein
MKIPFSLFQQGDIQGSGVISTWAFTFLLPILRVRIVSE